MTVAELLGRISSRELSEWIEFYKLEPFGYDVEMFGSAQVSATLVNINRKKGTKAVSAKDFYPKIDEDTEAELQGAMSFVSSIITMSGD